jgi:ABC-type molybdenum transport system ATPase subunit/photorepair protein PhrA
MDDLKEMANLMRSIESYSEQILSDTTHKQFAQVQKMTAQLADLEKPIERIEQAVASNSRILNHQMSQEILNWASAIPYQKHFNVVKGKAISGTGQWLFQDSNFENWRNGSRSQILWVHGSSGSGKSTLVFVFDAKNPQAKCSADSHVARSSSSL